MNKECSRLAARDPSYRSTRRRRGLEMKGNTARKDKTKIHVPLLKLRRNKQNATKSHFESQRQYCCAVVQILVLHCAKQETNNPRNDS